MEQYTETMPNTTGTKRIYSIKLNGNACYKDAREWLSESTGKCTITQTSLDDNGDFRIGEAVLAKKPNDLFQIWLIGKYKNGKHFCCMDVAQGRLLRDDEKWSINGPDIVHIRDLISCAMIFHNLAAHLRHTDIVRTPSASNQGDQNSA